jgi:hypothetical protein
MSSAERPRVLFVAAAVPPIAAPESIAVLKRLRALSGHADLVVVGADDPGDGFAVAPDPELAACLPADLEVVRVPWPRRREHTTLRAAAHVVFTHSGIAAPADLIWASRVTRIARARGWPEAFDRIVTDSAPVVSHLVGLRARRGRSSPPWVQHYSDPFVDLTYRRYHPVSRVIDSYWERRFIAAAQRVTVTSVETRALLVGRYQHHFLAIADRIRIVPNVYDADLFDLAQARYGDRVHLPRDGAIHAAYLGHFYGRRSIAPLCRWIDWRRRRRVASPRLRIHIFGSLRASERAMVQAGYADAIDLHAPVPYLHSLATMAACDLLLVVDAPSKGPSVHFPSKLADYLGAGRPIVAFTPAKGATARIAGETGHAAVSLTTTDAEFEGLEMVLRAVGAPVARPPQYANTFATCASMLAP